MRSSRSIRTPIWAASEVKTLWAAAIALCLPVFAEARAQEDSAPTANEKAVPGAAAAQQGGSSLPPIVVKPPAQPRQAKRPSTVQPATQAAPAPEQPLTAEALLQSPTNAYASSKTAPLQQTAGIGKTDTKIGDIPASIQIVPREIINEQGGTDLTSALRNVSGVNIGGPSSYGFFDRFSIRGLDARVYTDGFSDGDQLNGFPHSLNGISQIEVLKGPGSALLGTGPAGGTINMAHFAPSDTAQYGVGTQIGSFGTMTTTLYATGPASVPGVNYRVDGQIAHSDGFRDLKSDDDEIRPVITWIGDGHVVTLSVDLRDIKRTPDSYGIIYFNGTPLDISRDAKYSTPFSHGNQEMERVELTDAYAVTPYLTINNRFSYLHRDVDILRNSGGTVALVGTAEELTKRQLREQTDHDDDVNYMFEPVWRFATGSIRHTLLTGAQAEYQHIDDNRATADLQNITNIFAPVIPETSLQGLNFLRDAAHSGMIDTLSATYLGLYATDQIDVTSQLKVRLSARKDYWDTALTPHAFVPGRIDPDTLQVFQVGETQERVDKPFSWSAGTLYEILPGVSPYIGASKSYLTNFNSEATQNGIYAPESALQYEAGIKLQGFGDRVTLTAGAFKIARDNVFNEEVVNGNTVVVFSNQETRGVEADLQVKLADGWKILANVTAQNAVLTNEPQQPTSVGNHPIGIPAHIFNLWTTYDFDVAQISGFRIGGGVSYNDKTYGNTLNTVWIPESTVFDAVLSFNRPDWDIAFGVKNITDATYYTNALSAGGAVGLPRTAFVKLNYRW